MKLELELSKEELEGLSGLIDAGLRYTGIRAAKIASILVDKIQEAIDKSNNVETTK